MSDTELLAQMMIRQSLATGHGDTVADLVRELEPQVERLRAEAASWEKQAEERTKDAVQFIEELDRLRAEVKRLLSLFEPLRQAALMDDWHTFDALIREARREQ